MTSEEVKEAIRQHRAAQGVRQLEVEEWDLVGENCLHVPPMTVGIRGTFFDKWNKSQYSAMVWLVAKMSKNKDGNLLFSEPVLRNEADPVIIEKIFAFISEPFLDKAEVETDPE